MKLRRVKISEAVGCLLYGVRLAQVTWECLSVVRLVLSRIRHVGCDVHQTGDRWVRPCFRNYGAPIAVSDQNARSVLESKDALRSCDILLERRLRLLHDGDVVTIIDQNVVNAFPARTICPGTVSQNDIPNAPLLVLC